jgi:hypothetical protein
VDELLELGPVRLDELCDSLVYPAGVHPASV